jgi:hypothetical protein
MVEAITPPFVKKSYIQMCREQNGKVIKSASYQLNDKLETKHILTEINIALKQLAHDTRDFSNDEKIEKNKDTVEVELPITESEELALLNKLSKSLGNSEHHQYMRSVLEAAIEETNEPAKVAHWSIPHIEFINSVYTIDNLNKICLL